MVGRDPFGFIECHEEGGLPPDHACGESRNAWRKEVRSSCCTLGWI
jgi:hypothetical protein